METNETMNVPRVDQYVNEELRTAVMSGDVEAVHRAVDTLPPSTVTEGISNRLLVRDFLTKQKQRLVEFDTGLETADQLDDYARSYLRALDADFVETFVDDESGDNHKLTGDERLRQELRSSEEALELSAHILSIDVRELTPPESIASWMEYVRDSIIEELWDKVQDFREQGASGQTLTVFRGAVADIMRDIDAKIAGALLT